MEASSRLTVGVTQHIEHIDSLIIEAVHIAKEPEAQGEGKDEDVKGAGGVKSAPFD